jgi:hypothetical protein
VTIVATIVWVGIAWWRKTTVSHHSRVLFLDFEPNERLLYIPAS